MEIEKELIVGVEGGSTSSKAVLLTKTGKIVACASGEHTNLALIGVSAMTERLVRLLKELLTKSGGTGQERIDYLGLSLSGLDNVEAEQQAENAIKAAWQGGLGVVVACNDTVGSLRTAADAGVVLISGTGSNCRLVHCHGDSERVGGWGNAFGETGSAYGVVYEGLKRMIDDYEGLVPSSQCVTRFKELAFEYFDLKSIYDLIPRFYLKFDKTHIAKLTVDIAKLANDGDEFSRSLFKNAGFSLGRHVATVARKCEKQILEADEGIPIICVGSMWKSWDLLKEGFLAGLEPQYPGVDVVIPRVTLKRLLVSAGVGAAYLALEHSTLSPSAFQPFYQRNCEVFFTKQ